MYARKQSKWVKIRKTDMYAMKPKGPPVIEGDPALVAIEARSLSFGHAAKRNKIKYTTIRLVRQTFQVVHALADCKVSEFVTGQILILSL